MITIDFIEYRDYRFVTSWPMNVKLTRWGGGHRAGIWLIALARGRAFELSCCPEGRDIWIFVCACDHKSFPGVGNFSVFDLTFLPGDVKIPPYAPPPPPRRLDIDRCITSEDVELLTSVTLASLHGLRSWDSSSPCWSELHFRAPPLPPLPPPHTVPLPLTEENTFPLTRRGLAQQESSRVFPCFCVVFPFTFHLISPFRQKNNSLSFKFPPSRTDSKKNICYHGNFSTSRSTSNPRLMTHSWHLEYMLSREHSWLFSYRYLRNLYGNIFSFHLWTALCEILALKTL